MDKIRTIIGKEWSEVFKNRLVLFTVAFLPLVFLALPFLTVVLTQELAEEDTSEISGIPGYDQNCEELSGTQCMQIYFLDLYALMFLILPIAIPTTIAAYSIVGEKQTRSLEPLLATPITTPELLSAKMLAAAIPAILATWIGYIAYVIGMSFFIESEIVVRLLDPLWIVAIFVVGPLLTLLAVCAAMMVSSRVTEPRVAEQLSALVILPIILVIVAQSAGLILIDRQLILLIGLVVFIIDIVLVYLTIRLFERENILTRWK